MKSFSLTTSVYPLDGGSSHPLKSGCIDTKFTVPGADFRHGSVALWFSHIPARPLLINFCAQRKRVLDKLSGRDSRTRTCGLVVPNQKVGLIREIKLVSDCLPVIEAEK